MENVKITDELRQFLIDNECLDKFIKNVATYNKEAAIESIQEAFVWDEAREGFYFWSDIDYKFKTLNYN